MIERLPSGHTAPFTVGGGVPPTDQLGSGLWLVPYSIKPTSCSYLPSSLFLQQPVIVELEAKSVKSTLCFALRSYGMQSVEGGVGKVPATSRAAETDAARATGRASHETAAHLPVIV